MKVKQSVLKHLLGKLWRRRQKTPTYCLSLSRSFVMWLLKVKQSSSKIPKYFTQSVLGTFWPSNLRFGRFDLSSVVVGVKNENLVSLLIPILSESLFASSQFFKDSSSVLAIWNNVSRTRLKAKLLQKQLKSHKSMTR